MDHEAFWTVAATIAPVIALSLLVGAALSNRVDEVAYERQRIAPLARSRRWLNLGWFAFYAQCAVLGYALFVLNSQIESTAFGRKVVVAVEIVSLALLPPVANATSRTARALDEQPPD